MSVIGFDNGLHARMRGPSLTIWLTGAAVLVFVLWAAVASVDEIVRAHGEVV